MKKVDVPFIYSPLYSALDLPPRHRYPIEKYRLLKDWAIKHGAKSNQWFTPQPLNWEQVSATHCTHYLTQLRENSIDKAAWRRIGFPWSKPLLKRTLTSAGGTLLTMKQALINGIAIHFSGGYHHAHKDWGSGFCLLNDLAIACNEILRNAPNLKIAVLDTDVHQGDGTATLFANDHRVFTCSIHGERNFPFSKARSDLDIALRKDTSDKEYLAELQRVLEFIRDHVKPDLILYDAGVDIYQRDELGHLNISLAGIFQRDLAVLNFAKQQNIPIAAVIGGGYQRNLERLVRAHAQLLRASYYLYTESKPLEGKIYEV
ncbi:histone deacetylase family protein [Idiomarina aminovorans]|uniref:histone deacetylase family protein n=1 Tax=Idiomarina aminovorans TaxID=2914829 RepID=UPI0020049C06|nr:histone deacetylase [Idiomarina sp. ATCH4]MCK7460439.1 histone deacetylase [Idiomarina sp. ATCH4]